MTDPPEPPVPEALPRGMARLSGAVTAQEPLLVIRSWAPFRLHDLSELWSHRELLGILAWRDVSIRYKQTLLGLLWAVLQPALQTAIFTVLFNQMAGIQASNGVPFIPFVLAGIALWTLFSGGLTQAAESVVRNSNLVSKIYFPRLIIPLSSLVVSILDFAVAMALLVGVMFYYRITPGLQILWVVPLALQTVLTAAGLGIFLSAVNVQYRDVRYALPFFVQIMMYATPVFYPLDRLPAAVRPFFELNPLAALIEGFRAALFGTPLPFARLGASLVASLLLLVFGYLYFRRFERTMSDQI